VKKIKRTGYYVLLSLLGFLWAFPFLWMTNASFSSERVIFSIPPRIGDLFFSSNPFANYVTVLSEYNFFLYTLNTFIVAFTASIGQLLTCSLAGFAFARMYFRGKGVLFSLLLATMMLPVQIVIIPEYILMMKLHWLDTWAPLIVPSVLVGGLGTFLLRTFFENIPQELEDAAVIDGAGPFRVYWNVFLPLARTPLATLFIIAFITNWNELLRPILYIINERLMTLPMALTLFQSQYAARWHLLLTGSVITVLPLLIVYVLMQRHVIQGMTGAGIKG
jgi:multiple sugar transport system permease protein